MTIRAIFPFFCCVAVKRCFLWILMGFIVISCVAQDWQTDFEIAKSMAVDQNKNILLVFQGSDWCVPCIRLDREVWSKEEFKEYAKKHFVMLKADFLRRKKNTFTKEQQKRNNQLAATYNKNGYFPYVLVLNKEGKVQGEAKYQNIGVSGYIDLLSSFLPN